MTDDAIFQPKGIAPTDEQRAIQLERHKCVIVEANAGAAKTTTLALRLAQAIARGVDLERVLVLTYTDAAVTALRQALERIGVAASVRQQLRIQTFDEFCAERLLGIEGSKVPACTTPEQLKPHVLLAIERVLANDEDRHRDEFAIEGAGEGIVEGLLASFSWLKGTMQLTLEAFDQALTPTLAAELGHDYLTLRAFRVFEHLRRGGHPDHHAFRARDDATYDLARMLLDEEAFFEQVHPLTLGLHLVLVDEMHDTNRAMFTVLQHLLTRNGKAAFVGVGDRDQVIHAVAGADATFMGEGFDRGIAPAHRLPLTASYRFGATLARHAGRLARKPCASGKDLDTPVLMVACESPLESNRHITLAIRNRQGLADKSTASALAILLRLPHQSVELENHLLDQGVDYRTLGFDTYLMRPEVLFVRGLIAHAREDFAAIERPETRARILQALLMLSGSSVQTRSDADDDPQKVTRQAIQEVSANPALLGYFMDNHVLRNTHASARRLIEAATEVIAENTTDILLHRFVQALQPEVLAARVMVRQQDIEQVSANIGGLIESASTFDNVESFFRAMNGREIRQQAMRGKDCVVIATIEAAKGLEFDHVFMPGLNRGEFAVGGNTTDNRNLLYVGMTRARHQLTILHRPGAPSKYLIDAGLL